jgi:glutathione S-transferase
MSIPTTIILHHLENSRSTRILMMLEELKLPYSIKSYKRGSDLLAGPELKQVHPVSVQAVRMQID